MAWRLYIGETRVLDTTVIPPAAARLELDTLERSYDSGARLTFRQVGDWRGAPWGADSAVRLEHVEDGSATVVFRGRLDLPQRSAAPGQAATVEYSAVDAMRLLATRPAVDANGHSSFRLAAGLLSSVVTAFLSPGLATLSALAIDTTPIYSGGAGGLQTLPVQIDNANAWAALSKIAGSTAGVRVLMDPSGARERIKFVRLFGAARQTIDLASVRVDPIDIRQSLEGRCGAVKTSERQASGYGAATVTVAITPAWDASKEAAWRLHKANTRDSSGAESADSQVYRRYSFAGVAATIPAGAQLTAEAEYSEAVPPVWRPIEIHEIDWEAKTLMLAYPALKPPKPDKAARRNPNVPGYATPANVRLSYRVGGSGYVTVPGARFPASGFSGRAVAMAPLTCAVERQVEVPAISGGSFSHSDFARNCHAVYSEPVTTGTIGLAGGPGGASWPPALLLLDRRISLAWSGGGRTGLEALDAPLMGIRYAFAQGGRLEMELSSDRAVLLGDYG